MNETPLSRKRKSTQFSVEIEQTNKKKKMGQLFHKPEKSYVKDIDNKSTKGNGTNNKRNASCLQKESDIENTHFSSIASDGECSTNSHGRLTWENEVILAQVGKVSKDIAKNFVDLLKDGSTLPFIARYRKTKVGFLPPDRLQELFVIYEEICHLKKKATSVLDTLTASNKLTPEIEKAIMNTRTLAELEFIYAPLKTKSLSLAEKARNLGLESVAVKILNGVTANLRSACDSRVDELSDVAKVETHVTHIVADIIYKDPRVMDFMRQLKQETKFMLQSSRTTSSLKDEKTKDTTNKKNNSRSDPETYKLYFEFNHATRYLRPHQILAINRGEEEKILTVKIIIPDLFYNELERFSMSLWHGKSWVHKGLTDAYNRLIKPWLSRQVRSELTVTAHKEATRTFTNNLEKYLLTEPVKNRVICGIDPGFKAGCKVGIIDANGAKIFATTLYPNFGHDKYKDAASEQLKNVLEDHRVELIGLGNGKACRDTEKWLNNNNISKRYPVIIVPENGASVYSISKEATKEHPDMDPNLISALSIARRVLDPLGELIKVDPKNLGVGMYQHDIPPKMLDTALNATVEKIVSLVGVDVNTASHALLRRVAGLSDSKATKIIQYRDDKGGFKKREEILKVPTIGKVTYEQCSGFLRVVGGPEPLDATIIHPESYKTAKAFAKHLGVSLSEMNQSQFQDVVARKEQSINLEELSKQFKTEPSTLELILIAFKQTPHQDNILQFSKPVYSLSVNAPEQLKKGMELKGVVRNVVPFGCFVDCGVGRDGLVHRSKFGGHSTPRLGDRVRVAIAKSPLPNRIELELLEVID